MLISRATALGTAPVTTDYLERLLTQRIDLERIRQDRILHEALTSDATNRLLDPHPLVATIACGPPACALSATRDRRSCQW